MEVGLAVGGAFLSSALNVLFDRLASQGDLLNMFQKRKNDVRILNKLRMSLSGFQVVLSDAENKQASNQSVRLWLNELRDAVNSAENLIEEVNYEALRLKVEGKQQNLAQTLLKYCRICNQCLGDDFFLNIEDKLEETTETLENLQKQIGDLGLTEHLVSPKQETRTTSTSLVHDSDVIGREKEIEDLIGRLLSEDADGKNLVVVPIVGMGGLGKTTLAKAVYNDERVKNHFLLKAWFCVSEPYDALRITKGLLQGIGKFDHQDENNLNQLQVKLKENLKGKKFLIVLDDVWNENYNEWDNLRSPFVEGDIGSKIIVTTRKKTVALMMGNKPISMDNLSVDDSWSLFKRHAFENMDPVEYPELEETGKQIAAKCKGLPLSLKTLAGMLRSKSEVEEWKHVLRSQTWELPHNDILPALMLSYNDLPEHLKRCFSYCAIYPKDYQFCKDQVIHLWIANNLVKQFHSGNEYFCELSSRSLFEWVPKSGSKSEGFLMHDLVNDLAQIASSNLCISLEESQGSHMLEQCRHMSYSMGRGGDFEKLKPLEQLRTLLPINNQFYMFKSIYLSKRVLHNILPRLRSLRALSLSPYEIKELPDDLFIKLKLLRFLDLSKTRIKKLPNSICVLYYLETLLLSCCADLEELPLQMEKLINLHHLDISNTACLKMLPNLSKLKSLQVLMGAKFLVGGSRMEDLGEAQNLYGSLTVVELQNVVDRREAVKAKMMEKIHVDKLSLEWRGSTADDSQRDILDELRPHKKIKQLQITGYRGMKFPNWLADVSFHMLVNLSLSKCKDCDSLPALGQLPSLKFLSIRGMDGITEVTEEFYGSSSSTKPFNSLKKLEFEDMPEWKQWKVLGNGEFPTLEQLCIKNCPELSLETAIQLSSLKSFEVIGSPKAGVIFDDSRLFASQLEGMKQIGQLFIVNCNSLTSLPFSILPNTLKGIIIRDCQKLKLEGPVGEMFPTGLIVERCPNLTRFLIPPATRYLSITGCENVEKLSVACGNLPSAMTTLDIKGCLNLKWLPERMQELLPSLNTLWLDTCPEIESFPEGGLPVNLQDLSISSCTKLVNGRKEWRLEGLSHLRWLTIHHDGSDEDIEPWELPCSIQTLSIWNMKTLSSQLLESLTSLEDLSIKGNLSQIQSLRLCNLTSLQTLRIKDYPNLQSLSESVLPSSLSKLYIFDCPNLLSVPVNGMLSSLSKLYISNCPLLTPQLEFDKGEYWPNIAQIPSIEIDGECL